MIAIDSASVEIDRELGNLFNTIIWKGWNLHDVRMFYKKNHQVYQKIKHQIFTLLDPQEGGGIWDKVINTFIIILIVLNTIAAVFETVNSIYLSYQAAFDWFEIVSIYIFSVEYILRVWTATCVSRYKHPFWGRLKYITSVGAIIDLLSILPFFLSGNTRFDLRLMRSLRLIRFFRFFKLSRYINASKVITRVFESKKEELVLSFAITLFLIIISSSVMYYTEHDVQPDKFSSIPETMWWSVATLTTVGYGDLCPVTPMGKTLAAIISILGIGMFALPAGIIASGFSDEFKSLKKDKRVCQHCGETIE